MAPRASEPVWRNRCCAPRPFIWRDFLWLSAICGLLFVADVSHGQQANLSPDIKTPPIADPATNQQTEENGPANALAETPAKLVSYQGVVVDEAGKAIPNAELWYSLPIMLSTPLGETIGSGSIRQVATTDADGRFSFSIEPPQWNGPKYVFNLVPLTAKAPGYGCDLLPLIAFESDPVDSEQRSKLQSTTDAALGAGRFASRTLKLPREAGAVQGRLLDLEGRPLAGVEVCVQSVHRVDVDKLKQAFERSDPELGQQARRSGPFILLSSIDWQVLFPRPRTNENGEFTLHGLGQNQLATVTLYHELVDAEMLYLVGADIGSQHLARSSSRGFSRKEDYVGTRFTHAVGPGISITGIVTESQSGKPVANATVAIERLFSGPARNAESQLRFARHIAAVTDDQGRYKLIGVPPGKGHVLEVTPVSTEPLFPLTQVFSVESAEVIATVNLQLFRGLWIEGKVTDEQTGEPIQGGVDYFPFRNNSDAAKINGPFGGGRMHRFEIDKEGHYRVPGLAGPGVVMVISSTGKTYSKAAGANKIDGYDPKTGRLETVMVGSPLVNWNHISFVDPPAGIASYQHDVQLTAGLVLHGRVVDTDGTPAAGVEVLGEVPRDTSFRKLKADAFTVIDYSAEQPRDLFFTAKERSRVGHLHLEGKAPEDLKVELQPAVTVRGRLIDAETDEPAARFHLLCQSTKRGYFRVDNVDTTDDGQFELKGLLAGNVYQMDASNRERFLSRKNAFTIDLTNSKPGDEIELGDVKRGNSPKNP